MKGDHTDAVQATLVAKVIRLTDLAKIEYARRKKLLEAAGFNSYMEYMNSGLWADIKRAAHRMEKYCSCVACGSTNEVQLHHLRYTEESLGGALASRTVRELSAPENLKQLEKTLRNLVPLCSPCHESVEYDQDEGEEFYWKLSPSEACAKVRDLVDKRHSTASQRGHRPQKLTKTERG